ncbi:hypothetical protein EYF80_042727 [Liparis tanakae]|uniref:Uncharacterized protein n=1 Tax=Liparis tanakae TaxID=230148 RepID=A0A4Z2G2D2_9TELE|nr:hypothetical protein EYF80_042727 [Liparis tanakae]
MLIIRDHMTCSLNRLKVKVKQTADEKRTALHLAVLFLVPAPDLEVYRSAFSLRSAARHRTTVFFADVTFDPTSKPTSATKDQSKRGKRALSGSEEGSGRVVLGRREERTEERTEERGEERTEERSIS